MIDCKSTSLSSNKVTSVHLHDYKYGASHIGETPNSSIIIRFSALLGFSPIIR